jgi:transposase
MNTVYSLGVDVSKRKVSYECLDETGQCHGRGSVPTCQDGLRQLLEQLPAPAAAVWVVLEATGVLHLSWAEAFHQRGYPVLVLNPLLSKRLYATANAIRDQKTDAVDAHTLAEIGRLHKAELQRFRYQPEPARFGLQRLGSVRQQLRQSLTNLKKNYASLLDVVFPELSALVDVQRLDVRRLLQQASSSAAIARLPWPRLQGCFRSQAEAVLSAARSSLAPAALAQATQPALLAALQGLEALEAQLAQIDAQQQALLPQVLPSTQIALARTVPGIGAKTVVAILSEIPASLWKKGGRRQIAAALQALMGNDPRLRESGQYRGQTKMSKRGSPSLRTALFQATFCATTSDPEFQRRYRIYRARGKQHKVAISHLMRILERRLVAVIVSGRPYETIYAT